MHGRFQVANSLRLLYYYYPTEDTILISIFNPALFHQSPPRTVRTMSSSESSATFHRPSLADKIRRNDTGWPSVTISEDGGDVVEILDALKYNTVVKQVYISCTDYLLQEVNQEAYVKVSEVMKCNKSVESLNIHLQGGLLRQRLFATMATSGWSSIQELTLYAESRYISLRDAEHISSFIAKSENLRTFGVAGNRTTEIVETLSRTKVQSLTIRFDYTSSLQNGGRRLATALERCTCITELNL